MRRALATIAVLLACAGCGKTEVLFLSEGSHPNNRIYHVPDDGGSLTHVSVAGHGSPRTPAWSPDRSEIAFADVVQVNGCCNNVDIFVADRNGSNPRNLTNGLCIPSSPACNEMEPAWASTGEIAFQFEACLDDCQEIGSWEIGLLRGGRIVNLSNHLADDVEPAWDAAGEWIAFASTRSGNFDIWIMDRNGGQLQQITDTPEPERAPTWVRWGGDERIAYVTQSGGGAPTGGGSAGGTFSVIKVSDRAGNVTQCSSGTANDRSPAGRSTALAFISDRSGADEVYIAPANACSSARQLTSTGHTKSSVDW